MKEMDKAEEFLYKENIYEEYPDETIEDSYNSGRSNIYIAERWEKFINNETFNSNFLQKSNCKN